MGNASYKLLPAKKLPKTDREQAVLLGLVELYLKTGKPIGSVTLQEHGFDSLSSATIRNYFSKMEAQGFLKQPHLSGGRIPTDAAFRLYADTYKGRGVIESGQEETLLASLKQEGKEVAALIHQAAEALSDLTKCAVFVSTPRFDQDFVQTIRLIALDPAKLLSIVVTDFGVIRTEPIYLDRPVPSSFLQSAEEYFLWRMSKGEKPLFRDEGETKLAQKLYNEIMVRHVVGYANFSQEEILRTGLSRLLAYPEFNDAASFASSLSLLEDDAQMRLLLRQCIQKREMTYWIGNDLCPALPPESDCSALAIPYQINQSTAGAIAILGPTRIPYRNFFGLIRLVSESLSRALTDRVYKYRITFRNPKNAAELTNKKNLLENKND